jgi:hypothetical protein
VAGVGAANASSVLQLTASLASREHLHQHHHRVSLVLGCNEACTADVGGQLSLTHHGQPVRLRSVRLTLAAHQSEHVQLRLSRRSLGWVENALRAHRRVTATVTVVARGLGGAVQSYQASIQLVA